MFYQTNDGFDSRIRYSVTTARGDKQFVYDGFDIFQSNAE